MSNLALYRKYRPKTFEEVIGQDHIVKTLKYQIKNNSISHAYLFTGTRGTGKTSVAKIFARAVNCLNNFNGSPCLSCEICKNLENNNNIDIVEMDAASNNGVDNIRDLKQKIEFPPMNAKYKVYIIDEVHMLTTGAFNALLKTLEEPPPYAIFILATTEVNKLPSTILSRCTRFDFKLVNVKELEMLLEKIFNEENISFTKEAINAIALAGEGSVRDTLSIADFCASYSEKNVTYQTYLDCIGAVDKSTLYEITNSIINNNLVELFNKIKTISENGKNINVLNKDLAEYFRNILVIKTVTNYNEFFKMPQNVINQMKEIASKITKEKLLKFLQKISLLETELRYAINPKILFETLCLDLALTNKEENEIENENSITKTIKETSQQKILDKTIEQPKIEKIEQTNNAIDNNTTQNEITKQQINENELPKYINVEDNIVENIKNIENIEKIEIEKTKNEEKIVEKKVKRLQTTLEKLEEDIKVFDNEPLKEIEKPLPLNNSKIIFGKFLSACRESALAPMLYASLEKISESKIEDNKFIVFCNSLSSLNVMNMNLAEYKEILFKIEPSLKLEFKFVEINNEAKEKTNFLKNKFKNENIIIS